MLRTHKQSHHYDDELDDDDDDERHSTIELKDILNRKLPTTTDDSQTSDDDEPDPATTTTTDNNNTNDDNYIGRLTPQYNKSHRHRTTPPLKTAALALFLTLVGAAFIVVGIGLWVGSESSVGECVPFWVLGGLSFIPGSFHVVILYLAYTGQYGWTYDHIPTYERQ